MGFQAMLWIAGLMQFITLENFVVAWRNSLYFIFICFERRIITEHELRKTKVSANAVSVDFPRKRREEAS